MLGKRRMVACKNAAKRGDSKGTKREGEMQKEGKERANKQPAASKSVAYCSGALPEMSKHAVRNQEIIMIIYSRCLDKDCLHLRLLTLQYHLLVDKYESLVLEEVLQHTS